MFLNHTYFCSIHSAALDYVFLTDCKKVKYSFLMVLDTSRSRGLLPSEWRKRFVFGFEVWIEQFLKVLKYYLNLKQRVGLNLPIPEPIPRLA